MTTSVRTLGWVLPKEMSYMKAMIEALISEIQVEAATTRRVLDALPQEKYSWKPHERSMSAGVLATHMARFPQGLFSVICTPSFDVGSIKGTAESLTTKAELLKTFDDGVQAVTEGLLKMPEAQASEIWAFKKGEQTLVELPRISAVKTLILNHLIHHRGQLSVYLRLLDVPVPSIYGPSADVNPFS